MKSALRGFNPTIFLLPRVRGATSGEVSEDPDFLVPYGKASVMQEGSDITIVAIGSCVHHAIRAAKALTEDGISVELIDPRTLVLTGTTKQLDAVFRLFGVRATSDGTGVPAVLIDRQGVISAVINPSADERDVADAIRDRLE